MDYAITSHTTSDKPKIKIAAWGNSTGATDWRLRNPFKYLPKDEFDAKVFQDVGITKEVLEWCDIAILQSTIDKDAIALAYEYQQEHGKKIIVDIDDYFEVNDDSPFKEEHEVTQASKVRQITCSIADLITTTTPYFASQLSKFKTDIVVLPNFIDVKSWHKPHLENNSDQIRIGWAGSMTHLNDLKSIIKPLKKICDEFPNVKLVFCGDPRIAEEFKGYPVEIFLGVPFNVWPTRLAGLRLDIGLAPLTNTMFNRCKSNIKWQEYSINKIPGIYSKVVYADGGNINSSHAGIIAGNQTDWYEAIKELINNKWKADNIARNAYEQVTKNYSLEKNIELWAHTYRNLLTSK